MIEVITEVRKLFKKFIGEVHYQWNHAEVVYPYLVYTYTSEPSEVDNQAYFYIDFDIFDDRGSDNERIEQVLSDMQRFVNNKDNQFWVTDDLLVRIISFSASPFPTGSDTLQRRTGQFYIKIDWRE